MTTIIASATRLAHIRDGGRLLRLALRLDAAASGALGVAALAGASLLAGPLGAGEGVLRGTGGFLVAFAIGLAVLAGRPVMPAPAVWTVVLGNLAWTAASIATAVVAPLTGLGVAVVVAQAIAVAVFADLEWLGLRRAAT